MAKRTFLAGVTSQTIDIFVQDSSSTIGAGLAALAFNTSGLKAYYRKGATGTVTAITLATQTVGGAWSSGGFVETDATNMKGVYRFDIPDTVLAATPAAILYFYGATNMAPVVAELEIVSYNPFDAVRLGLTALPNATVSGVGGLLTAPTTANVGLADLSRILGTALTETAGLLAGGFKKFFNVATPTGTVNSIPDAVAGATGGLFIAGTNAATTITTALTTTFVGNQTGNLSGSVGSVTGLTASNLDATVSSRAATGDAMTLTSGERNSVADALLNRDMSTGTDGGSTTVRTVRQALRFLRNKWSISAGTLTVTKEDDSTTSWTSAMSTDAAAVPVIGSDPAGP